MREAAQAMAAAAATARAKAPALFVLLAATALVLLLAAVNSAPANAASCTDQFTGEKGTAWAEPGNWTTGVPNAATVVCLNPGTTPEVSTGAQEVDSIEKGETLTVSGGGSLKIANASHPSLLSGTLTVSGTGKLEVADTTSTGALTVEGGEVSVASGASLAVTTSASTISGTVSGEGKFAQEGATTTVKNDAKLETAKVSVSAGMLSVEEKATYNAATETTIAGGTLELSDKALSGNYTQESKGTLAIKIDGTAQFGQLDVTGEVELAAGSTLSVEDGEHFAPEAPETFQVIAGSLKGIFGPVGGKDGGLYEAEYEPTGVTLGVKKAPPAKPGPEAPAAPPTTATGVPVNTAAPVISGSATVGGTLSCSTGSWTNGPTSFGYQWYRSGTAIAGATKAGYTVQQADVTYTLTCSVRGSDAAGPGAPAASSGVAVPQPLPLLLACSGKDIELVTMHVRGRSVFLSGVARVQFAGQKVAITVSGVPHRVAVREGGRTTVSASGAFVAKLPLPQGRYASLTRYTATLAGHSSLFLKLARILLITRERNVKGGLKVTFRGTGVLRKGSHTITIIQQVGCTKSVVFARKKLGPRFGLTIKLPAPGEANTVAYYRAQTPTPAGLTYSLPIAVASGA